MKSSSKTDISIYWNNKSDLNYVEVTANKEMKMQLDSTKKFYFEFYVGSKEKNGNIVVYFRTDIESHIYLCKNKDFGMMAPSK